MTESMEGVERVTAPVPVPKTKNPKKVEAGRAGAAARKAKQERLLEELRAAKQSLQSEAVAEAAMPVADIVVAKQQPVAKQQSLPAPADPADPVKADWTPWLLFGAGLAVLCVWRSPLAKLTERQQKPQHLEVARSASSGGSQPDLRSMKPQCAQQLKVPDPFHME